MLLIWILVLYDLDMIPLRIRAALMVILTVAMGTFMFMGYSGQPVWVDVFDCVVASILSFFSVLRAMKPELEEPKDNRPGLTMRQRVTWAALYGALAAVLIAVMVVQAQYLPHHVQ